MCGVHHGTQAAVDQLVGGFAHDALDQLGHAGDVVDQAGHHAAAPGAGIDIALHHGLGVDAAHQLADVLDGGAGALGGFDLQQLLHAGVVQHAFGVAQRAHDQAGVQLAGGNDGVLHVLVDRGFLGAQKACAHVHAIGAQRECRHQAAAVGHAAGGDKRDLQRTGGCGQQNHIGHVVLAGVAAAFKTVHTDGVAADAFGLERMAHGGAFVDHLDAGGFQGGHIGLGLRPAVSTTVMPPSRMAAMYSSYGGWVKEGRKVRLTPNGWSVMSRVLAISWVSFSGVPSVRAVIMPRPPALETAAASGARPT
jgi:hypothetical protein